MICKSCGRTIENPKANFCDYCGDALREQEVQAFQTLNVQQEETKVKEEETPVAFGNWLGSMLLLFIPFVGAPIYITMLIYWSFSAEIPESKRNWARAALIVAILLIFMWSACLRWVMQQLVTHGIDLNSIIPQV